MLKQETITIVRVLVCSHPFRVSAYITIASEVKQSMNLQGWRVKNINTPLFVAGIITTYLFVWIILIYVANAIRLDSLHNRYLVII